MCVGIKPSLGEKSTVLREDDLTALLSNSKLTAGVIPFNHRTILACSKCWEVAAQMGQPQLTGAQ